MIYTPILTALAVVVLLVVVVVLSSRIRDLANRVEAQAAALRCAQVSTRYLAGALFEVACIPGQCDRGRPCKMHACVHSAEHHLNDTGRNGSP